MEPITTTMKLTTTCPHCGKEVILTKMVSFHPGGIRIWSGCWTCLGHALLRGIAAVDKVDELESRVVALEKERVG